MLQIGFDRGKLCGYDFIVILYSDFSLHHHIVWLLADDRIK